MSVIDAHMHLAVGSGTFDEWAGMAETENTVDALEAELAANDVAHAVLIGHWKRDGGTKDGPFANGYNNALVRFVEGRLDDRFKVLLGANVTADGVLDLDALEAHLDLPNVAGVKFFTGYEPYSPKDPRLEPLLSLLEVHGKVAMFHTGDTLLPSGELQYAHPLHADDVAVRHPALKIVLAHAGQHWMADAGEVVGKNPNVWADVSGWFVGADLPPHAAFLKEQFKQLVYWSTGTSKLMFGSDWPLMRIEPYLRFLHTCDDFLSEDELDGIRHWNARALYGWGPVPS